MKKILFIDIDGTLINYEAQTPPSAKEALRKAKENDHLIFLCTGCSKFEVALRDLPLVDGMILANGAYIEYQDKVIYHKALDQETVSEVINWCKENKLGLYLECNDGMYCDEMMLEKGVEAMYKYALGKGKDAKSAKGSASTFLKDMILEDEEALVSHCVNKISFILSTYDDFLKARELFKDYEVNTWGGKGELALFGDISPHGINKGEAIKKVLAHLNLKKEDAVAFGDAKVDLLMFKECGYKVAMGNGGIEIKEAADFITKDVDDDGLYHAFLKLGLF